MSIYKTTRLNIGEKFREVLTTTFGLQRCLPNSWQSNKHQSNAQSHSAASSRHHCTELLTEVTTCNNISSSNNRTLLLSTSGGNNNGDTASLCSSSRMIRINSSCNSSNNSNSNNGNSAGLLRAVVSVGDLKDVNVKKKPIFIKSLHKDETLV